MTFLCIISFLAIHILTNVQTGQYVHEIYAVAVITKLTRNVTPVIS